MVDVRDSIVLAFDGGIAAGNGDLVKKNGGTLVLSGASPNWDGMLTVDEGLLSLRDVASLGTAVGATRVNASGTLRLINDVTVVNEIFQLDGGTLLGWNASGGSGFPTLTNQIELLSSGRLENVNTSDHITLNGLIEGPGDITYGRGRFSVLSDNTYEGLTTIEPGRVSIRHENGLGSPAQGTVVNRGGNLVLLQSVPEPITLRGGVLLALAATSTGTLTLESGMLQLPRDATFTSPLVLANTGNGPIVRGDRTTLTGGVTGIGDLSVRGSLTVEQQPLTHEGGLVVDGGNPSDITTLNAANSYAGPTVVRSGQLVVNHEGALGTSSMPVNVSSGELVLNVAVNREINLGGTLRVNDPLVELTQTIRIGTSAPPFPSSGLITGQGVYNGEIILVESPFSRPFLNGGTFNGPISGRADQLIVDIRENTRTILNANNSYRGITILQNGPLDANTPTSLGDLEEGTLVTSGELNINAVTDEPIVVINRGQVNLNVQQPRLPRLFLTGTFNPTRLQQVSVNVPSVYDEHVDVVEGTLAVNANTSINDAVIRESGKLLVAPGASLHVGDDDIEVQSGRLEGTLAGVQLIRKTTGIDAELGDLPGYTGDIRVEKGRLRILSGAALGTSDGVTHVLGRDAVLQVGIQDTRIIEDEIYLHNALGDGNVSGLFVHKSVSFGGIPTLRLEGAVHLGSEGSSIGGPDSSSTADDVFVELVGPITGGDLITRGRRFRASILTSSATYSGVTDVQQGTIELSGAGRLANTKRIILHEAPRSHDGTLHLRTLPNLLSDYVADSIPITFRGGKIVLDGEGSEKLGNFSFAQGHSGIELRGSLTAKRVEREPGAIGDFFLFGTWLVEETDTLTGSVIPWMVVRDGFTPNTFDTFGKVANGRVRGMSAADFVGDINTATSASNVLVTGPTTLLAASTTVNSITAGNSSADLDLSNRIELR